MNTRGHCRSCGVPVVVVTEDRRAPGVECWACVSQHAVALPPRKHPGMGRKGRQETVRQASLRGLGGSRPPSESTRR